MAAIDELINKIENPSLKLQLQQQMRKLLKQKKFGLVFEDHLPESTIMQGVAIRPGLTATFKANPHSEDFYVRSLNGDNALCISLADKTTVREIPIADLVPFATFGEPIYPYLKVQDSISTDPDSPLWHSLIEADNYHALQLLAYLYPDKVDCIYIDPPYNTGARDWKYNNDYVDGNDAFRHSKWLSMMKKRLLLAKKLLNPADSVLIVTIDEKEYVHLGCLLEEIFPAQRMQMVSVQINASGIARSEFSRTDEYYYFVFFGSASPQALIMSEEWHGDGVRRQSTVRWESLLRSGNNGRRIDRPNLFYPVLFTKDGKFVGCGESLPLNMSLSDYKAPEGQIAIFPRASDLSEARWRISASKLLYLKEIGAFDWSEFRGERTSLKYLKPGELNKIASGVYNVAGHKDNGAMIITSEDYKPQWIPGTQWHINSHQAGGNAGSGLIKALLNQKNFDFPKSLYAVHDALRFFVANKPDALIVDFFAGSGTTLHAVNLLNAEDGGHRRCIMVTNNEVGEQTEKELSAKGFAPGDEEWERLGIARYVNWPRTVASITGNDVNGNPIKGEYLTYKTTEKESNRKFQHVTFVRNIAELKPSELQDLVSVLTAGRIAKSAIGQDAQYIIGEDADVSVLLDDNAAADWLEELEGQEQIKEFIIVSQNKKLFNQLKSKITEMLGKYKETVPLTLPMADGFKANAVFFKLGFLDKYALQAGRQFAELLPLLWMKAGAHGVCPSLADEIVPTSLILPQNRFAVLTHEGYFEDFVAELSQYPEIQTVYIITNSEKGYREMVKSLRGKTTYQLYRDYLDNFSINTKDSI